jgi:ABC-2 type transport system permease protein
VSRLAGTGTLTRLALRRDRFMVPAWVATFVAVTGFSAVASKDLYGSTAELVRVSEGWNATAATVAMHGRIYDPTSLGAGSMIKMTGMGTAMVGLLAILLVIRHTRADEEVGRTELAAGGVVGQYAPVAAGLIVSTATVAALSVLSALTLIASGLPAAGSIAFASAWIGAGLVFAMVAAVAAQLATTARAARGLASAVLAATYAIRAVGDTSPAHGHRWVSWLSPLGWAQQVRPFAGDRWWALVVPLVAALALAGLTFALLRGRDLGAGLLVDRPGAPRAPQLTSALKLAWRQQRLALLAWAAGAALMGVMLGSIASTIADLLDNEKFRDYLQLLGGVDFLEDAFLSTELTIAATIVSAYGISAALRMRSEEAQGRVEPLLAAGVDRTRFVVAHTAIALAGTTVLMAVVGLSVGLAHGLAVGDPDQVGRVLGAALARLPAVWLMTTLVLALFGLSGRLTVVAWVLLVGFIVVGEFGPLMELPSWTLELSPFAHLPALPGGRLDLGPSAWLTGLAVALSGVGVAAFRRRDLQSD